MEKANKYLGLLTAFFAVILLTSNIVATKLIILGPFTFDGGTLLFPLSYVFGDIMTEVYGYKKTRKVIWIGFFMSLFAMLTIMLIGAMPASPDWANQEAYSAILGSTPRIILASLTAYFVGEFLNSFTMAKMKVWTKGKFLWLRTITSTLLGEGVDTVLFVLIAFMGVFETDLLIAILISNYIFKVAVEVLFTPATYLIVGFLKKTEKEDYYDKNTNFNPFSLKS
jgi:uncharacterized integral membrane protein (TIGR00697 family)